MNKNNVPYERTATQSAADIAVKTDLIPAHTIVNLAMAGRRLTNLMRGTSEGKALLDKLTAERRERQNAGEIFT